MEQRSIDGMIADESDGGERARGACVRRAPVAVRRAAPRPPGRGPTTSRRAEFVGAVAAALVVLLAAGASAQSPAPPANDDCLACHGDSSAVRSDGRSVAVDPDKFKQSVHGELGMACVDCHADLAKTTEFPHPEKLAPVNCATCHEDAVAQYASSVHAKGHAAGGRPAAACVDCHGMHDIRPKSDPASRTYPLNIVSTCAACHGGKGAPGAKLVAAEFADSIHGQALSKQGLLVAPNCATCHGAHAILGKKDPNSRVHREHVIDTCTQCHAGIKPQYEASIHAAQVRAGNPLAPVCSDCHTAHGIRATGSETWQLGAVQECGTCHEQALRTYRDTFHGKVTELGFTRVATCASCHGPHGILPASNPASRVSAANRLNTCRSCHPQANENFVKYDPHANPHDPARNPVLSRAYVFMRWLLIGTFLFFGIHTVLWLPRSWQARRSRGAGHPGDADRGGA